MPALDQLRSAKPPMAAPLPARMAIRPASWPWLVREQRDRDVLYGIWVIGSDNFIARNIARANTLGNFSVVAGNELAPVVTNPGSSNFTTATPWSNFAY